MAKMENTFLWGEKQNSGDGYTKAEIDAKLTNYALISSLADYYTKLEIDKKFNEYVLSTTLLDFYNKTQTDSKINESMTWKLLNPDLYIFGGSFCDITFALPVGAKEMSFSGRFRNANSTNQYYGVGGSYPVINSNIFIPTYLSDYNGLYVSQIQTNGANKILRVFNAAGSPVAGPAQQDSLRIYWR